MFQKLSILFVLLLSLLFQSQEINKIEFYHSNAIIMGSGINISLEPIKDHRKKKVKVTIKKDDGEEYNSRISRDKFIAISNAVQKIKQDTIAVLDLYLDPSSSSIVVYNKQNSKSYYADGLTKKSQRNEKQKDFWYATKLILCAAKLKMEDLTDYR